MRRPSHRESPPNGAVVQAEFIGPVEQALGSSVHGDEDIAASISRLFLYGGPPAISGFVSSAVVYSFEAVTIRTWPYVGQKGRVVVPSITNGNTASTVPSIALGASVSAPFVHRCPSSILAREAACDCRSMRACSLASGLTHQACAAPDASLDEVVRSADRGAAAFTPAYPFCVVTARMDAYDGETTEHLSGDVFHGAYCNSETSGGGGRASMEAVA